MAVQAQYPSNVLLLNRTGQERKDTVGGDYSLQAQVGEFLDQSQMLFSNGGTNPRKRGRETVPTTVSPVNLFSLQPQPPPTKVNLSHLHNQQNGVVSTGLRLSLEDQQQQQQQRNKQQSLLLPFLSEDLATQIKQQRDEIDQFLQAQGDQLRRTLAERRHRHYRALLGAAEESATRRLRDKETEVERAIRHNLELEERVAQLRAEAQVWQAKARAHEATVTSLQAQLQQAMMVGGAAQDKREELGCSRGELPVDDAESAHIDPSRIIPATSAVCKSCRRKPISVVLLPCRHFCLCIDCDAAVTACPICHSTRSASVEVYLS